MSTMANRRYEFAVHDVSAVYAGPGAQLWELLMGEQIHVGGPEHTDQLAARAGLRGGPGRRVLDLCSALGGPARHLAQRYGATVVGVDITPEMIAEAQRRTAGTPCADQVAYRLGSALDIPGRGQAFDVVWGQDAWCYVRDKARLIQETWRVLRPGGTLAFTDWIWGGTEPTQEESDFLMRFMVFPDMQTFDGYTRLLRAQGYTVTDSEYLGQDFAEHIDRYVGKLQAARPAITEGLGAEAYAGAEAGLLAWQAAAHGDKVGRGLWVAHKA